MGQAEEKIGASNVKYERKEGRERKCENAKMI
jgi:hypothetical protein